MLEKLKRVFAGRRPLPSYSLPGQLDDHSRILAMASSDLSDLIFHMPILHGIRRHWPGASLDFLVPESFASLVIPSGLARQVLVYSENQLVTWKLAFRSLRRALSAAHYDATFVLSSKEQPALEALGLASDAVLRYGPAHASAWPSVNLELRFRTTSSSYLADRLLELAPFLGLDSNRLRSAWPLPADKLRQVAQVVHFNKPRPHELLIGIDPGPDKAGRALSCENLVFLVNALKAWLDCRILPLCGPGGQDRLGQFEAQLGSPIPPAFNRDTLLDTVLLLYQCDLFMAGNTDLFHMAVAVGVPSIGLFGDHVETAWHPDSRRRCALFPIASGKRIDTAGFRSAVETIRSLPDDPDGMADPGGLVQGPLPASGA